MDQENKNISAEQNNEAKEEPVEESENKTVENNQFAQNILDELKNSREEITSLKDQLLRMAAEMENLRRRTEKQIEDSAKYAVTQFVKDIINVAENFKRALSAVTEEHLANEIVKSLYQGLDMTNKELMNIFSKHKVIVITPNPGDDFDHNLHQAVANADNSGIESGKIAQVLQSGYMLHDRLIRPAMVMIAN